MNSKNIIIAFLIFFCIYSCKNQENGLGFNQSISNEFVYITPDIYSANRDSLKIDIPLEFYIKNNSNKNYDYVETTFYINKKYVYSGDFTNIDKYTRKVKYDGEWKLPKGEEDKIISHIKTLYINLDDTKKVFKKYAVNKDIENFRDSAKIVPYRQFRKDFPEIIKKMEKIPDVVEISTRSNGKKAYDSQRFKIKW